MDALRGVPRADQSGLMEGRPGARRNGVAAGSTELAALTKARPLLTAADVLSPSGEEWLLVQPGIEPIVDDEAGKPMLE